MNIVLRVRETDCTGWRAECPEKKKTTNNSRSKWGNIQQAAGIKKELEKASLDVLQRVITIYCVGGSGGEGGRGARFIYRGKCS